MINIIVITWLLILHNVSTDPCKCVNTISDCSGFSNLCDNTQYNSITRKYCSAECPRLV